MRRALSLAGPLAIVLSFAVAGQSLAAAPCKDAQGKFTKCAPAAAAKPAPCKDAKGKFTKCPAPAAKAPMATAKAPMTAAKAPMATTKAPMTAAKPKKS